MSFVPLTFFKASEGNFNMPLLAGLFYSEGEKCKAYLQVHQYAHISLARLRCSSALLSLRLIALVGVFLLDAAGKILSPLLQ